MTKVTITDHTVQLTYSFNCVLFSLHIGETVHFFLPREIRLTTYTWKDFSAFLAFSTKQKSTSKTPTTSGKEIIYLNVRVSDSFWGIRSVTSVCGVVKFWNLLYFFSYFTLLKKTFWEHIEKWMDQQEILHTVRFPLKNAF